MHFQLLFKHLENCFRSTFCFHSLGWGVAYLGVAFIYLFNLTTRLYTHLSAHLNAHLYTRLCAN